MPQRALTLWLDAAGYDQNNGVWKDKSGKENKVKQDNEASRRKTTEDLNNRPVVLFDGDKYLELGGPMVLLPLIPDHVSGIGKP